MGKQKLILWDIDGTLIVSHNAGVRAMSLALEKRFGVKNDLLALDWAGRTDSWITGQVFRQVGLEDTPQNSHDYLEAYLAELPQQLAQGKQGTVLPGILELLETIHHRADLAQGLLTGNLRRGAEFKLTHYKVWHYFEFGAFADDSAIRNELGPHALRRAGERHQVKFAPDKTFIIGDTPHDIECGKAIGARTIGVATGRYTVTQLAACAPTAVFSNFSDTTAFLRVIDAP
ncbi:HAD family hydrolase [Oleiharenicola lentus]|uniref:HAD family hydrolase n=1 Tax=Oleiharenicola lentus TaxID=2508720 RepID=UPI003F673505